MATGVGMGFSMPDDFLQRLNKADKALQKIAESSDKTATAVTKLANDGFGTLANKLDSLIGILNKANNTKIGDLGLKKVATEATNSADAVARFNEIMGKINNVKGIKNSAVAKITEEIEVAKKRLEELQGKLNFYAKGEGQKALGFLDTGTKSNLNAYQEEANQLMRNIALLERQKASLEANARLRLDSSKKQQDLDNAWYAMEREKKERERQFAEIANRNAKQSIEAYKQSYNERYRAYEEMFKQIEQRERQLQSYMRSFRYSHTQRTGDTTAQATAAYNRLFSDKGNVSLNNMQSVLTKLSAAQRKLNLDTEEGKKKYEQLAAMIRRVQQRINEVTGASDNLQKKHSSLLNTGDQLMRKFALIFSVSQIQGYINKLVQVRGEFELQQRALQSILQNKAEANKIWQQTVDLAVRSPFRVKELVTYTKQLAAYRIETDKLHDTTKRLADISAGLGVDMNRLILAYGQVRAAEYLRGTELRQFTEAGIPLLDELAKHFTELEGRAVSTADVFGMISKRMVAFEDVEAVFKKMTDAGGVFYNMQEIQAETLKGQISNLHDSIDLMLNDIGKYYDGVFKAGVSTAKVFVDNWEGVAYAIKAVVLALVGYKMATLAANIETQKLAIKLKVAGAQMNQNLTVMQMWNLAGKRLIDVFKTLGTGIKMALPLALLSVAAEIVYGLYNHFSEMNKALDEIKNKHNEELDRIEDISDAYNKLIAQEKKYGKASDDTLEKKRQQIIQLSEKLGENVAQIELQIKPLTSEQLDALFKNKQALAIQASDFSAAFSKAFVENFDTWQLWGILGENMKEDAEDFNEAVSSMSAGLKYKLDEGFKEASRYYLLLSENAQGYIDEIKKGKQINETEAQWFSRKAKLMSAVSHAYQEAGLGTLRYSEAIKDAYEVSKNFEGVAEELKQEVDDVARDLLKTFGKDSFKDLSEEQKISFVAKLNESEQLAELGLASDFIRSYLAEQYFGITINLNPTDNVVLQKWQDSFNKKFGDNLLTIEDESYYGFREITDNATTQAKVIEQLQGRWKSLNDEIKAVEKAGAKGLAEGGSYEGYNLELSKQNLKQLQEMMDWFGADYEKKKGKGKQRDIWGERSKAIQDLRKNYEDLIKTFTKYDTISRVTTSKQKLINELFKDLGYKISNINFDSLPQLVDFITKLQEGLTEGSEDWLKLEKVKAAFQLDIDVKTTQQARDEFMRGIESMFGNYEMSLELEKLNIPPDLAKQLFGVESVDLSEIRRELETHLAKLRAGGATEGADEEVKKTQEKLKKVEELERKAQEDRLKKYVKYLTKAQDARVKIKLEELRQIAEVEKEDRFSSQQKEDIKTALQKESKQALDKQAWEDFTGSKFYMEIFKDMENASTKTLEIMRDRLMNMKDSLKENLNPEDLKAIVEQIEKIDDKLRSRQAPEWRIGDSFKGMAEYLKNRAKWEKELANYQKQSESKTKEINALAEEIAELQHITETVPFDSEEYINVAGALYDAQQKMAKLKKESKGIDNNITKFVDKLKDGKFNLDDFGNGIKATSAALQGVVSMIESLNIGLSEGFQDTLVFATSALSATDQMVEGFTAIATNPKSLGGYIQALAGITTLIGSYFEYADKRLERQISDNIEYVEKLQRAYEKLEKQIEDAYSVGAIQTSYDLAKRNMNQQLRATQNMIEMEEKKKKKDEDRIKDWKNEIEDMNEQLRELEEQRLEDLGGLGSDANYKSAAEDFTEAWFDAYREVGDGISGLEDTFDEFINNVVKKQLLIRGSQQLLQPLLEMIDNAVNDGMVTTTEMAGINKEWNDKTKDALNEYYKAIYDMYDGMIAGAGELSDLQRGIQNITEPQAAAIEAYLNSVRTFVSDSNATLKNIYNAINVSTSTPIMSELRTQTELIHSINENIGSVIGRGRNGIEGAYIKVLAH